MKEKIAFVVVRYGKDINGGAEYHCQMLAERLIGEYDVEVLTTCVRNVSTGDNYYAEGIENWNGVVIRRFKADPVNPQSERTYTKRAKPARRLRRLLYQLRLLKFISVFFPVWNFKQEDEINAMNASMFYSSGLNSFIQCHKDDYKAFVAMSLDYPTFYYTALYAGEKMIAIPTMHYAKISFRSLLTLAISKVAYVGFNTGEEQKLGERIFGKAMKSCGIISVGIETPEAANWEEVKIKFQLPEKYLLYVGRITHVKLYHLLSYFLNYKKKYVDSTLKLVLVGGITIDKVVEPDIIYTGFVSDEEKMSILQHAEIVVNPSNGESLSLILLEAMNQGKPMLVNGCCKVLKEHCLKSDFASFYYKNGRKFNHYLHKMENSAELHKQMAVKGRKYVADNYNWKHIMKRMNAAIDLVGRKENKRYNS